MSQDKTILIIMLPAFGHINCTFHFAQTLKKQGYRVVYLVPPQMSAAITQQGFETQELELGQPKLIDLLHTSNMNSSNRFLHRFFDRFAGGSSSNLRFATQALNRSINAVNPDLIFIDAFTPYTYFYLENKTVPVLFLQIMFATKRRPGIPPLNSRLQPEGAAFDQRKVNRAWKRYSRERYAKHLLSLEDDNLRLLYARHPEQRSAIRAQLDFEYCFRFGVHGISELILAPRSLDYNEISPNSQIYLASSIQARRTENWKKDLHLIQLMRYLEKAQSQKKIIYCSLGTLNVSHNPTSKVFLKKVIHIFAHRPEWELILSTGEIPAQFFGQHSRNVHVFKRVPQLEVLKYADVMITHGGINSILECIDRSTPQLIYPLNNDWDQNGNAARITHYKLGLMGDLSKDSEAMIENKIQELLDNQTYARRIEEMRQKIATEQGMEQGLALIDSLIKKQPVQKVAYS